MAAFTAALALSVAACGSSESSDANEASGTYAVKVTKASFPSAQHIGSTSLMKLGIRNAGRKTIPALTVSISVAGEEGQASTLPFGVHDPEPGLAQPDRPVWVLAARYPRFAGSSKPAGAETSNPKTFDFGPLKRGKTASLVWKLSAVKAGRWTVLYSIDAGLDGEEVKAKTTGGVKPGGSFTARVSAARLNKEVTGNGEIVDQKSTSPAG
ncbi:MAG: hypothetical protein ACRDLL_00450 [Solirubrobacterales bacterium]